MRYHGEKSCIIMSYLVAKYATRLDFLSQTAQLIGALKRALKTQGKTYSDIARYLSLSEASVKRTLPAMESEAKAGRPQ